MSLDEIIQKVRQKELCGGLICLAMFVVIFVAFLHDKIVGTLDVKGIVTFCVYTVGAAMICFITLSDLWHLSTGRYEYYTEEEEKSKFCEIGDKQAEALGIGPDEPVCEVTITHVFDLHSHPKRVLTTKETKLKKESASDEL